MSICALGDRDDHDTLDLGAEWLQAKLDDRAARPAGDRRRADARLDEGRGPPARDRPGDTEAADLRRVPRAARGDRSGRAEAAPVRLLRQLVQPSRRAGRDRARRARRRGRAGGAARVGRRVLGQARDDPQPARARRRGGEGAPARPAPALVRRGVRAARRGVARGGRARRRVEAGARGEALARAARRADAARLPVHARARDPDDRALPQLVDAPLGDPLGAQGHEDLLLPDRTHPPRRAPRRPRSRASTRRSATRGA